MTRMCATSHAREYSIRHLLLPDPLLLARSRQRQCCLLLPPTLLNQPDFSNSHTVSM